MKLKFFLRNVLLLSLFATTIIITSCGSDDGDEMDPGGSDNEISLAFTIDGTSEEAVFNSGSIFLALSNGEATVLSTNGALQSGSNYSFTASFTGTTTGTYNLTQGAGEIDETIDGVTIVILEGQNSVVYVARNVTLNIQSYTVISLAQIIVEGTFSGTFENEDTQETVSITNGSFVTGNKE